jgi:hypothetical protein
MKHDIISSRDLLHSSASLWEPEGFIYGYLFIPESLKLVLSHLLEKRLPRFSVELIHLNEFQEECRKIWNILLRDTVQ